MGATNTDQNGSSNRYLYGFSILNSIHRKRAARAGGDAGVDRTSHIREPSHGSYATANRKLSHQREMRGERLNGPARGMGVVIVAARDKRENVAAEAAHRERGQ